MRPRPRTAPEHLGPISDRAVSSHRSSLSRGHGMSLDQRCCVLSIGFCCALAFLSCFLSCRLRIQSE